jgi:hypothetical protein
VIIALIAMGALGLAYDLGNRFDSVKAVILSIGAFFWGLLSKGDPWPWYHPMKATKTLDTHTPAGADVAHRMWDTRQDG